MKVPRGVLRWVSLLWGLPMMVCTGTLYGFSAYSEVIKERLHWSGKELNLAVTLGLFGGTFFSFAAGFIVDRAGHRIGALYGTSLLGIGYTALFLQVKYLFTRSSILSSVLFFLVGQGGSAMWLASVNVNVRNWPENRRTLISGVLSMMTGLSAAIFTYIYRYLFADNQDLEGFFLVFATAIPAIGIVGIFALNRCPPEAETTETPQAEESDEEHVKPLIAKARLPDTELEGGEPLATTGSIRQEDPVPEVVASGEITTFLGIFKSARYMSIYIAVTLCGGAVVVFINNLKLIMLANGIPQHTILAFVAVTSYGNCGGRILFAVLSFVTLLAVKAPKPRAYLNPLFFLLIVSCLSLLFSSVMIMQGTVISYLAAALLPVSYGGWFGVLPAFVCSAFGEKRFGFNYGFVTTGLAIANVIFGQISGAIYDVFTSSSEILCWGANCFRYTFIICAGVCGLGFASMLIAYTLEVRRQLKLTHQSS
jgi:MFS family permease